MANILPTDLFPGYASDGTNITIPIANLPSLIASEADAATGDGREVARGLVKTMQEAIAALDPSLRPVEMTAVRNNDSTQGNDVYRQSFSFTFDVVADPDGVALSPEA